MSGALRISIVDAAEIASRHLSTPEIEEIVRAFGQHAGRAAVELSRRVGGRDVTSRELASALLATARACARGGDA